MRQDFIVSTGMKKSVQLVEMSRSGVAIAEQILLQDLEENTFDSLHDSWALLADEDFSILFEQGTLEIAVIAETGKFPINALVTKEKKGKKKKTGKEKRQQKQQEINLRNILSRLLRTEPFFLEDKEARTIIDSLIDWIDSNDGDKEEEYGAENNYYQSLSPPYSCKNKPFESIEELLLVKGITRELLYGTKESPPLAPLLTVYGDEGKININSADPLLLQAIDRNLDKQMAENMVIFREDEKNKAQLGDPQWYRKVPSFPGDIADTIKQQDLITVVSNYFTIQSASELTEQKKITTAVVKRSENDITILRWDSE